ncbi:MAG: hypothetical protein KC492_02475, partial [Myxococcales bacterium]|nr:hypothetical protein [Myxococcales bacterium]
MRSLTWLGVVALGASVGLMTACGGDSETDTAGRENNGSGGTGGNAGSGGTGGSSAGNAGSGGS